MLCFLAAMVTGQLTRPRRLVPVLVAAAVAVLARPWLPQGWNVIAGALTGALAGSVLDA